MSKLGHLKKPPSGTQFAALLSETQSALENYEATKLTGSLARQSSNGDHKMRCHKDDWCFISPPGFWWEKEGRPSVSPGKRGVGIDSWLREC